MNLKYVTIFQLKKLYWLLAKPQRQGVKCVLENNGEILMIKRSFGTDKYVFPGGAIKKDETADQSVKREIKEDLGIMLSKVLPIGHFTQTVHHRQETLYCFKTHITSREVNFDKEKVQAVAWFNLEKLPELTPVSRSVILQYLEKPN